MISETLCKGLIAKKWARSNSSLEEEKGTHKGGILVKKHKFRRSSHILIFQGKSS